MSEFAGSLSQRIEFWERAQRRLPSGASSEEMQFAISCLAAIVTDGAGAADEAMSVSAMQRFRITIRYSQEIRFDHQVRWQGRKLAIHQITQDPKLADRLVLRCEELR